MYVTSIYATRTVFSVATADIHEAFLSLGCAWICWQSLRKRGMTG